MKCARKILFGMFVPIKRHKDKLLILSRLSDSTTCNERFNINSDVSISQLWNFVGIL